MPKEKRSSRSQRYDCLISEAGISSDGQYRWWLYRAWDLEKPLVIWVMMNPSTADHRKNDPTIMKVMRYSQRWGFGGILVMNIYSYRTSRPEDLPASERLRIGDRGNRWLKWCFEYAGARDIPVICAWGSKHPHRSKEVKEMAGSILYALELSKEGEPKHPRFLSEQLDYLPLKTLLSNSSALSSSSSKRRSTCRA